MRIAIINSKYKRFYIDDLGPFTYRVGEARGQNRYVSRPSAAKIITCLQKWSKSASVALADPTAAYESVKAAVYPTPTTVNVSTANLAAIPAVAALPTSQRNNCIAELQDMIAPKITETGDVLMSFASGKISKLASPNFRPGGFRITAVAGAACVVLQNDGISPFTLG